MSHPTPVVHEYKEALDHFRRAGRKPPLLKRMSELISLLDLTTTLSSGIAGEESLNAALRIVMSQTQAEGAALFLRRADGTFEIRASCGLPPDVPSTLGLAPTTDDLTILGDEA